ncbi:putative gram domain-containing protein [Erysiphe necator]|uniref:Putative gram domain-containing protein n=1 Tax=Uncinula necator TaxID=52586 RepID=A0A0B1PAI4_UNCNE|nr:putative gram domain-containing protein [Erysiphe necator]
MRNSCSKRINSISTAIHLARSRAETYPATNHPANTQEISHVQIQDRLEKPREELKKRSTSPAGRLKVVLRSRRSTLDSDNNQELTTHKKFPIQSNRGSVASRIGLIFYDKKDTPLVPPLPVFDSTKQYSVDSNTHPRAQNPGESTHVALKTPASSKSSTHPHSHDASVFSSGADINGPNVLTPASEVMISSGRITSGSATLAPSKLSNITSTPPTPTPHTPTPEHNSTPNPEGFFSTVLNVAQNAATTLSNSIGNNVASSNNKNNKNLPDLEEVPTTESENTTKQLDPAVKTLGIGDLSLEHLGISENSNNAISTNTLINNKSSDLLKKNLESTHDLNTTSFVRSLTLGSSMISEQTVSSKTRNDIPQLERPRTVCEPISIGDHTPPNGSLAEANSWTQRSSSSHRSNSNRSCSCRKRASSANTTCTTIGAAIVAANSSIVQQPQIAAKVTGFAVASRKRNKDFHQLFRSVPDDDYLIEDYSCALQREILAHGRLYVSEGHLCFSSNIFGWVTTLVMSFDEIVSVEKRSTALVFKNGLMITTLHAKNVFASFTSRDSTYDLIVGIWKLGYPSLRSSLNGVHLTETGGGDKTEKYDCSNTNGSQSDSDLDIDGEDDIYDEADKDEDEDNMSFTNMEESLVGSDISQKNVTSKAFNNNTINNIPSDKLKEIEGSSTPSIDFPGPLAHAPTECSVQDSPFSKITADELIPSPMGRVWNLIFGSGSQIWFRNFITVDQKCFDYTLEENAKKPLALDNKVRNYSYIKPLGGPIGPKQTKCICVETLEFLDFEKYITVTISTQTPDVPSGNIFSIKTRYCFTWGPNNCTRLQISYMIEWTGKSWLKGPIEKGATDGQFQYAKEIVSAIRNTLSSSRGTMATSSKRRKSRRRGKEGQSFSHTPDTAFSPKSKFQPWVVSHEFLESFMGILRPLLTGNIMYGLLVGLLVASWFRFGFVKNGNDRPQSHWHGSSERLAAYEEIWRKEESELWKWLEDRVGMELLRDINNMPIERARMDKIIQEERHMQEWEIEDAIRVTEERLQALKKSYEEVRVKKAKRNNEDDPLE